MLRRLALLLASLFVAGLYFVGAQQASAQELSGALTGRVLDTLGNPLGDVSIDVLGSYPLAYTEATGRFSVQLTAPADVVCFRTNYIPNGVPLGSGAPPSRVVTGGGVATGSARLCVDLNPPLNAGETRDLGDVVLPDGGQISGKVTDKAGHPLAGVAILSPMFFSFQLLAVTDNAGNYTARGLAPVRPDVFGGRFQVCIRPWPQNPAWYCYGVPGPQFPPGCDPVWWTPRKRGCSLWEVVGGRLRLSTRTRL